MTYTKKIIAAILTYLFFVGMTWEWNPQLWSPGYTVWFLIFELYILFHLIKNLVTDHGVEPTDTQDN